MAEGLPDLLKAINGWKLAEQGEFGAAYQCYQQADKENIYGGCFNPELSLLRHKVGFGLVEPPEFDEKIVPLIHMGERTQMSPSSEGMVETSIKLLSKSIQQFIDDFNPGFHAWNITQDLPHVMVLSTGRCGTVSLYRLFQETNIVPYHAYWWNIGVSSRWEMMCRLMEENFHGGEPVYGEWLASRAAEWLGPMMQGRIMVGLNHTDTIFAPVFAALHPESKFIWLHRDSRDVIKSFISKNQSPGEFGNQLRPLKYKFDQGFAWHPTEHTKRECVEWYVSFTNTFCKSMQAVLGDRMIKIEAESLFERSRGPIHDLIDFIGVDLTVDEAVKHFKTPINVKACRSS